jgi:hypothetical protein
MKDGGAVFALKPSIDEIGPFLKHVTALLFIFGLVVDAP